MKTELLCGTKPEDIRRAGEILRNGGLAAIPTETVYGLAANALDGRAVKRIFETKGRPGDNPLIVHICALSQWAPLVKEVPPAAQRLAESFWPGPLTIILEKSGLVPVETSGGLPTVAVRFPSHPVAQAVIRAAGVPLAAPSANPSGRPSPTAFAHVRKDLMGKVEALVDGGDCDVGVESTVVTLASGTPRLLRPGGVTLSQLRSVLGEVEVDPAVLHSLEDGRRAASPGMKYRHYSPRADVVAVDASPREYVNYVNQQAKQEAGVHALCFDEDMPLLSCKAVSYGGRYDGEAQAHRLFAALIKLDEMGAKRVLAHMPRKTGVGLAVYNRLIRAAGFQTVRPGGIYLVGLTGPSGAGKSTVGKAFQGLGAAVLDCDALTRSEKVYNGDCVKELQNSFGVDVAPNGRLDRKELARRAFQTEEGRKRLGEITFPHIEAAVKAAVQQAANAGKRLMVLDAPTLFESGLDMACARIIAVTAPEEQRLARVMARDGVGEAEARLRFAAQKPESFYLDRADHIIENTDGEDAAGKAAAVFRELEEEA